MLQYNGNVMIGEAASVNTSERQKAGADDKFVKPKASLEPNDQLLVTDTNKKIPYPKSIYFILTGELIIQFAILCAKTSLILYLNRELGYSSNTATIIIHLLSIFGPFFCILGAIISDTWLGKFKTILFCSLVYFGSLFLLTLTAIPLLKFPERIFSIIGLVFKVGSGSIMLPCVLPFGADQYKIPEQATHLSTFFLLFYFMLKLGGFAGNIVAPYFREDIYCFDRQCYALIFGVSTVFMMLYIVIFCLGHPFYKMVPPAGNMVILVCKTIWTALTNKCKEKRSNPRTNWLDYADIKFNQQQINDVKVVMRVLFLFLPLPFFWALYNQQFSRWVFQATLLNGDMGSWDIKPEHMQLLNPLLVLILIPIFKYIIYPALKLIGIKRPLQKFTIGGILAGISFIPSAILQLKLESEDPVLPQPLSAQLRIFNGVPCDYTFSTNIPEKLNFDVKQNGYFEWKDVPVENGNFNFLISVYPKGANAAKCIKFPTGEFNVKEKTAYGLFMKSEYGKGKYFWYEDNVNKPKDTDTFVRTLANIESEHKIKWIAKKTKHIYTEPINTYELRQRDWGDYQLLIDDNEIAQPKLRRGGTYTFIIYELGPKQYHSSEIVITNPNSINILWQIPQILIMAFAEILVSITGMEFSYSQAPISMKSVLSTCWILTQAFGNAIVVIVAEARFFKLQSIEFFFFAGIMFLDMFIFMILAYYYKPYNPVDDNVSER